MIRAVTSRKMRWADHLVSTEEIRYAYKILVGKCAGKQPLGRSMR